MEWVYVIWIFHGTEVRRPEESSIDCCLEWFISDVPQSVQAGFLVVPHETLPVGDQPVDPCVFVLVWQFVSEFVLYPRSNADQFSLLGVSEAPKEGTVNHSGLLGKIQTF